MSVATPNSYLRDAVMTATPEQLQLMLYDGAIRFATQGRAALLAKDYEVSYLKLSRAQAIVLEMEQGLRSEVNPELCDRMAAIYGFCYRRLVEASVNQDPSAIDDALKILRTERETWVIVINKVNAARADGVSGDAEPATQQSTLCVEG